MKVSLSWLNDYIAIEMEATALAEALTMVGLEVESVFDRYGYLDTVHVGRISEVRPHAQADKLRVCEVDVGDRRLSVVCGAPNVKAGMLAPLALPGTVFPDGAVLEQYAIRGQISAGMLCSEAELGLGVDREGIMVLDASLAVGSKLAEALRLSDTVLEIDLTPNRPDCLSMLGIAREIAAIQKIPLQYPDYTLADREEQISKLTSVKIEAPNHCPRYAARLLENIAVAPSPFWLQDRLLSVGLRPINNIVDITNYVLMETGQPLHAFDFDRLAENSIVVSTANPGETFVTLDQKERSLDSTMLMICDGQKPVAIAGVMGGLNSEIEAATHRVLIESAYFAPVSIRKTSKKLGLNTEASHRFERGIDPEGTIKAVNRAARLMAELASGRIIPGIIDEHPRPPLARNLTLTVAHTNRLLGTRMNRRAIADLLESIEFSVENKDDADELQVVPPPFRVDISRPEDLMEEVARLAGYNNIPTTFPLIPAEGRRAAPQLGLRNRIKDIMSGFGFTEAINYSFAHPRVGDRLRLAPQDPRRAFVAILNPLTEDQATMRTSLIPGLLEATGYNLAQQVKNLKFFEVGRIFINKDPKHLPQEIEMLAGLWTGARSNSSWLSPENPCDFYDIKGAVEGLLTALRVPGVRFTAMPSALCHYTRSGYTAQILSGTTPLGLVGQAHPQVLANYNLKQSAFIFELEIDRLASLLPAITASQAVPKFPAVFRDITVIVSKHIETQEVLDRVESFNEALVESLHLFDVFTGDPIPSGKKSISFRVTYRSHDKTLEDEDISQLHKSITARLLQAFEATLPA
ncbi:MAG: phenylalanine--tRNA ligase subunit beta [Desulfobacterales bacterium]|nr:MAG: phenylalanine--tRNA ligase subunit beta [Desulfobacterales bacterium]